MTLSHLLFEAIDGRRIDLVATVATDAVRLSLWFYEKGRLPRLLAHTHEPLRYGLRPVNQTNLFAVTAQALERACREMVYKQAVLYEVDELLDDHREIHTIAVYCSSPWFSYHIEKEHRQFDKPTVLSASLLQNLWSDVDTEQSMLMSVLVNGYPARVDSLPGKRVKEIDYSVCRSRSEVVEIDRLLAAIHSHFITNKEIQVYPLGPTVLRSLYKHLGPRGDYAVLYIHAEQTELFVYNQDSLKQSSIIYYGFRDLTVQLAREARTDIEGAHNLFAMYKRGHLSAYETELVEKILRVETEVLFSAITDELEQYVGLSLPYQWYLVHDHPLLGVFARSFEQQYPDLQVTALDRNLALEVVDQDQSDMAPPVSLYVGLDRR